MHRLLLAALLAVTLTGCATGPSTACEDALEAASEADDSTRAELLAWSATACPTQADWLAALHEHPTAVGQPVDDAEAIELLCAVAQRDSPACSP